MWRLTLLLLQSDTKYVESLFLDLDGIKAEVQLTGELDAPTPPCRYSTYVRVS